MAEFVLAQESDAGLISRLGHKIFGETYKDILSEEQIEYMLEMSYSTFSILRQMQNNNTFYIVYCEGEPCGYIAIERKKDNMFHLQKLYLHSDMHGQNIGREMMNKVYEHAKELSPNGATITLNVNRENPTLGFYKKMGWEIIDSGDFELGGGFYANDYIMKYEV